MAVAANILPVILARADSARLPGKVLLPILDGSTLISSIIEQVNTLTALSQCIADAVVASTERPEDDKIEEFCLQQNTSLFRDSYFPLKRLCNLAQKNPGAWLWRLNADSPLILIPLIQHVVSILPKLENTKKLVTNLSNRSFPYGVSLEMYRADWLSGLDQPDFSALEIEHITPLCERLDKQNIYSVEASDLGLTAFDPTVRLTIDTQQDAEFFKALWQSSVFKNTEVGSAERINFAYNERNLYEI